MCLENMKNFQETPSNEADEQEESSWTCYFEEFLWQNDEDMILSCDETLNSRVPPVASNSAINKIRNDHQDKKLRFKKRKTIGVMLDDSLEDTASSPVSSPKDKVAYYDQVKIKNKNNNKVLDISKEKVGFCEEGNKRKINPNMEYVEEKRTLFSTFVFIGQLSFLN